jgi:hypothetical protein
MLLLIPYATVPGGWFPSASSSTDGPFSTVINGRSPCLALFSSASASSLPWCASNSQLSEVSGRPTANQCVVCRLTFKCCSAIRYLIDAYTTYAASAVAANTVLRSLVGGLLPLAGLSMYDALGLGWGNSLIAFIALALTPIPLIFYIYGERLRNRGRKTF